ncbi:hypothetical protein DPMN_083397 [Dreissena polymorpha]|uniref:Uncharacterized protein n=1 Tax=Dreissena polymorpha TaxID=45954 RepID=A0A9D3Y8P5_DREPO|nr:hypothetical protein DPMN_083397 [Dreissena polymorpha]
MSDLCLFIFTHIALHEHVVLWKTRARSPLKERSFHLTSNTPNTGSTQGTRLLNEKQKQYR